MSKRLLSVLLLLLLLSPSSMPYSAAQEAQIDGLRDLHSSPVMFIENADQWPDASPSDTTPPDTALTHTPPDPDTVEWPTFSFTGSDSGGSGLAGFQCQLDVSGWFACTSPYTTPALADGSHTFSVRAIDGAGNPDPTPATHTWTVDTTPPIAADDGGAAFTTGEKTPFTTGNVLSNDSDPGGGSIVLIGYDDSALVGVLTYNGDGTFDYDPNGQFEALGVGEQDQDSFTYTIADAAGLCDTAQVIITITGANDPALTISGRVLQGPTTALAGVTIASSAGQSTTTDVAGYYVLSDIPAGTYEITPSLTGYVFSPTARSVAVSEVTDEQNFWGRTTNPFLDFPADYESTAIERALAYGDNGYINSYFDHAYPNYKEPTSYPIRRYDGATTYEAYGGHDGLDFDDHTNNQLDLTEVLAAQAGVVTKIYDSCNQSCPAGSCCEYLGNRVEINHGNGYLTIYGHLAYGSLLVHEGFWVDQGQKLGLIGSTGVSSGPHIHFEVNAYTQQGWQVVDPFGWTPLNDEDPWVSTGGPDSYYLWNWRFENGIVFLTDAGTTTTDPAGFADSIAIAPTTDGGEATATVTNSPSPSLSGIMRSLGRYFRLVLDWLAPTTEMQAQNTGSVAAYTPDITITMPFSTAELLHLDPTQLAIQHYDPVAQQWNSLPTTVDFVNNTAVATTNLTADFAINAPLLCSGDLLEPDDEREKATPLWLNNAPLARLLDISKDADWAYFAAVEGIQYTLATQNLMGDADTVLRLYDSDGVTLMGTDDNGGGGLAASIQWIAPRTGTYFVEVTGGPSGSSGCSAAYELVLTGNPPPRVDHELLPDTLGLSWRHDNAAVVQYEVWDSDLPYFAMVDGEGASKTDVGAGELGALVAVSESLPTDGGHYYRVRGATGGDVTPASRELGVFTISLVQGSP